MVVLFCWRGFELCQISHAKLVNLKRLVEPLRYSREVLKYEVRPVQRAIM